MVETIRYGPITRSTAKDNADNADVRQARDRRPRSAAPPAAGVQRMSSLLHPHRQAFAKMFALQTVDRERGDAATEAEARWHGNGAGVDPRTGLPNAVAFERACRRAATLALRSGEPLCLALLRLGDLVPPRAEGREESECAVALAASMLGRSFRTSDLLARWSEDTFAVLFPRTELAGAVRAVEKALVIAARGGRTSPEEDVALPNFHGGVAPITPGALYWDVVEEAERFLAAARRCGPGSIASLQGELDLLATRVLLIHEDGVPDCPVRQVFEDAGISYACLNMSPWVLQAAESSSPTLVVVDLGSHSREGLETLTRIRRSRFLHNVPVIALSSRHEDLPRCFEREADDFLLRPFRPIELLARAQRLLVRRAGVRSGESPARSGDRTSDHAAAHPARQRDVRSASGEVQ
ncbi:hypothetical protein BH23GEM3_BH23GEM3_18070 [soil metagenome]